MKLSLVFPSWYGEFGDFKDAARSLSTFPPLNLCIVAALAKKAGWQVHLVDAHIEGLDDDGILAEVRKFQPDLIGLSATSPFYPNAYRIAQKFKKEFHKPVILGGPHASYYQEKALEDGFDYVIIGECETMFVDFLIQYEQGNRSPDVPGVMLLNQGQLMYKGPAAVIANLDQAPMADRSVLKNELYFLGTPRGRKRYTTVQMSRGCPFSCVFCASDLYGKRVRRRSMDNVMMELEDVVNRYGAQHIYFVDDVLTLDREYIYQFCDAVKKSKLKFTFEGGTRANQWDEDLAYRLKECGLVRISFGLESADEEVRKIIRKGVPLSSYHEANKINNRLGIETTNSAIIGLPGDTRETIQTTIDYLCSHREIQHVTLNIAMPYPGTQMYAMAQKRENGLKLVEKDLSKFQRYGSAVMEVNQLTTGELVVLQRKALLRIYACWWRWIPVIKRFGLKTVFITGFNTISSLIKSILKSHDHLRKREFVDAKPEPVAGTS